MKNLTICVPVYKRLDYLSSFVESIPEDYPVCVSDNGNFIPDDYFSRGNVRIKHIDTVVPMFSNWNQAIDMVSTDWFMIPGDDDIIYPEKLDFIMSQIEAYPDCGVLAFGYDIINERNERHSGWSVAKTTCYDRIDAFRHIQRSIPYRCPAVAINTAKSRSIGNYDEAFAYTAGDSLYLQHLALKYPVVEISEVVAGYRMWENNFTNMKIATKEWFDQLELWIAKLSVLLKEQQIENIDLQRLHDAIIYDNLSFALGTIRGYRAKLHFISSVGWPQKVGCVNHLKLVKRIIC